MPFICELYLFITTEDDLVFLDQFQRLQQTLLALPELTCVECAALIDKNNSTTKSRA